MLVYLQLQYLINAIHNMYMKKILIVDDDPIFPGVLADVLSNEKYTLTIAVNGKKGLEHMRIDIPDLVILDLMMPEMSGTEVLKAMREDEALKRVPVLICSNMDTMNEISGSVALGANGYIIKSNDNLKTIVDTIDNMFTQK